MKIGERFWDKVDASGDCWEWTGGINGHGYGIFSIDNQAVGAHRVAYQMLVGPIPKELQIDHLCRVRHCVNPDHMEPVTMRENILRGGCPAAVNSRRSFCREGHPLGGHNLHIDPKGKRRCRECDKIRKRRERASKKVGAQ